MKRLALADLILDRGLSLDLGAVSGIDDAAHDAPYNAVVPQDFGVCGSHVRRPPSSAVNWSIMAL
jgi:hypothetical protein